MSSRESGPESVQLAVKTALVPNPIPRKEHALVGTPTSNSFFFFNDLAPRFSWVGCMIGCKDPHSDTPVEFAPQFAKRGTSARTREYCNAWKMNTSFSSLPYGKLSCKHILAIKNRAISWQTHTNVVDKA